MKVLFVTSDNSRYSGAFLCIVNLAEILKNKYGHDVLVILPHEGNGKDLLDERGISSVTIRSDTWTVRFDEKEKFIRKVKFPIRRLKNDIAIHRISRLIVDGHVDIVHINTLWTYVGAVAALNTGTPFVWHAREFLEEDQNRRIINRDKGYRLLRKATHAIAVSGSIYKKYSPIFGKNKMSLIYDGIDPNRFVIDEHKIFAGSIHEILIMGTICAKKGQLLAINACMKLHDSGEKDFCLKIAGTGNEEYIEQLQHYVQERNASHYILFCGRTDKPEKFFRSADITLMCSDMEAFGRVTVEAMMSGSLVIASDSAGSSEIVKHKETGLLFKCGDVDSLKDQIKYSFSHADEMREIAKQGAEYALTHFTAERNAEEINSIYKKIITGENVLKHDYE